MNSFYFYHWNQFRVIPISCTLRIRNLPQISCDVGRGLTARQITQTSVSRSLAGSQRRSTIKSRDTSRIECRK